MAAPVQQVWVDGETVRLQDVLPHVADPYREVVIALAPPPGGSRLVSARMIRARLKEAHIASSHWPLRNVRIRRRHQDMHALQLRDMLALQLKQELPHFWQVRSIVVRRGEVIPAGDVTMRVVMPKRLREGKQRVRAELYVAEKKYRMVSALVDLQRRLTAQRSRLKRGDGVIVEVRGRGVEVRTRGVLQHAPRLGEVVQVLIPAGQKVLQGKWSGGRIVRVDL